MRQSFVLQRNLITTALSLVVCLNSPQLLVILISSTSENVEAKIGSAKPDQSRAPRVFALRLLTFPGDGGVGRSVGRAANEGFSPLFLASLPPSLPLARAVRWRTHFATGEKCHRGYRILNRATSYPTMYVVCIIYRVESCFVVCVLLIDNILGF